MNRTEKLTIAALLIAIGFASALFGVWEDKVILYAPLLVLVYLAVAVWAFGGLRRRQRSEVRDQRSEVRGQMSETARDQMAEVKGQKSDSTELTSDLRSPTSGISLPPGGVPLLLFWLYSAALIPFSVLPYEAKISVLRFGCYLGVYWASANILSRFSYRKAVWTVLFVLLLFIALYSLVQHRVAPNLLFGMERYADYWKAGRLGGTYQCPNHIAHLFQMGLPFCFVFLFIPQFGWFRRICFAYAVPLFLLLIYQTQSRASLLGTVAALCVTVLLMILRKSRRGFMIALLVVPLLGAAALGGLWAGSSMFRTRMQPVVKFFEHQMNEDLVADEFKDFRPLTWLDTMDMIKERPVFGFGPGNYGLAYEEYRTRFTGVRIETVHAHNEYLELVAEYGLIGGALVFCALISLSIALIRWIRTSPRSYHALPAVALLGALAGTAVHGFFDFELRIFPNALLLALLAGCAVAPVVRQRSEIRNQKSAIRFLTSGLWLLTSVFLLLAAGWSLQVMSSAWIRARGDQLLLKQNFPQAEKWFKPAEKIDPQNWPAQWGFGQIDYYERYNELDPARKQERALKEREAYANAYRINPKKAEVVYGLGRVELFLGNRDQGLDYLRQAANYKRFNDFYWRKLGIELRKAGLYEEALTVFEYAQKLDRANATVKRNIQWLKKQMSEDRGQTSATREL
jgi:O-antigen ligase